MVPWQLQPAACRVFACATYGAGLEGSLRFPVPGQPVPSSVVRFGHHRPLGDWVRLILLRAELIISGDAKSLG